MDSAIDDDDGDDKHSNSSLESGSIDFAVHGDDDGHLEWTLATISALKTQNTSNMDDRKCSCVVENLIEGRGYRFRVVAHNEAGKGGPSPASEPVVISGKTCEMLTIYLFAWCHDVIELIRENYAPFSATPLFLEPLENVEVLVGRSVELQVEVDGKPRPTVTW